MSLENKAKATAKNLEGKAQETIGHVTGDPKDKAEGKAKQTEAGVRHTSENLKEKSQEALDHVSNQAKAAADTVIGKVQEFMGDATDDPATEAEGHRKQAQGQARRLVDDAKHPDR